MPDKRLKWRNKIAQEIAAKFKASSWYLSQCQCDDHASYKRGYQDALRELGMFLEEESV